VLKRENHIEMVALIVFGLIVVRLLFVDPVIGLSDNGDFGRIMSSAGLGYFEPNDNDYFGFVHTKFMLKSLESKSLTSYLTTHNIPVIIAKILSETISENIFNTKYLAFIYALFLLVSFFLIIKNLEFRNKLLKVVFIFALLIILSDANSLSYFNSYMKPVHTFLISLIVRFLTLFCSINQDITLMLLFHVCL
jgi:hypothetical protein